MHSSEREMSAHTMPLSHRSLSAQWDPKKGSLDGSENYNRDEQQEQEQQHDKKKKKKIVCALKRHETIGDRPVIPRIGPLDLLV